MTCIFSVSQQAVAHLLLIAAISSSSVLISRVECATPSSLLKQWETAVDLPPLPTSASSSRSLLLSAGSSNLFVATSNHVIALDPRTGNSSWIKPHGTPFGYDVTSAEANDINGNVLVSYAPNASGPFPPNPNLIVAHSQSSGEVAFTIELHGFNNSVRQIQRNDEVVVKVDAEYLGNPTNTMRLEAWSLKTGHLLFNVTQSGIIFINGLGVGTDFAVVSVYSENSIHNNDYVFDLSSGRLNCYGISEYASSPYKKAARVPTFANGLILGQGRENERNSHSFIMNSSCWRLDGETVSKRIIDGQAFSGYSVVGDGLFAVGYSEFHGYNTKTLKNWDVQLPQGSSSNVRVASKLSGNHHAVVANMQGAFSAVNGSDGAVLWKTSTNVAAMPFSNDEYHNNPVQVYPLREDGEAIFVPNPSGYTVLNTTDGSTVTSSGSTSTFGTAVFFLNKPLVVYADKLSNAVMGFELRE